MYRRVPVKTVFLTALVVAITCSAFVSISTILLRPVQDENRQQYMLMNIFKVAEIYEKNRSFEEQLKQLETHLVDLESGKVTDELDVNVFNQRKATKDPELSITLSIDQDIAGIKRRANYAPIYFIRDDDDQIEKIILPVSGYGLWSTLYGFIALERDTSTVIGLRFYEHAETPGLGGEIDNSRWLAQWKGKKIFDARWKPKIQLVKGGVAHSDPDTRHQIDAISGASLTNRGIENLLKFWLGKDGFGPFLSRLRRTGELQ